MAKVAIAYSTKDRCELTRQTIPPILDDCVKAHRFHTYWVDGSDTEEGQRLPLLLGYPTANVIPNVRGGADSAIAFSLSYLLDHKENYDYIGLIENDVLLPEGWFEDTMALFGVGLADRLLVGAASARTYEDRILIQRDGYAVMHNIGAGMVIFSRTAAQIVLRQFRTGWSMENRRIFGYLSGLDIGRWWAFRAREQWITADWRFDAVLAAHGFASVALTPSKVQMVGQVPPLEEQGLKIASGPVDELRNDEAFDRYRKRLLGQPTWNGVGPVHEPDAGGSLIFPHQLPSINREDWRLKWSQGFGPFAFVAREVGARIDVELSGPVTVLVSGGKDGGKVAVSEDGGYSVDPDLLPEGQAGQIMQVVVPGGVVPRTISIMASTPGITFYGIQTRDRQFILPNDFHHSMLPEPT